MARKGKRAAVPSYAPTSTPVISTHTATHQWQSFEMRMRRRRASRCVLRAEVALEAGFEDDAREALDEARRLDSTAPDFDTILATVVTRMRQEMAIRAAARMRRVRRTAAAAVVALASLAGTAALMKEGGAPEPVSGARLSVSGSGSPLAAPAQPPEAAMGVTPFAELKKDEAPVSAPRNPEKKNPEPKNLAAKHSEPRPVVPENPYREPDSANRPFDRLRAAPSTVEGRAPATPAVTIPLPVVDLPLELPSEPLVDDSIRVRAVLSQYEAAYSALNVAATRAIWPSVDARSLTRAFDGLDSQRVSLGQCALAIDGRAARADCQGHASYTPKVGGITRTETRQWKFELKNADGTWQIVRAEMR